MSADDFTKLLGEQEELHPSLAAYMTETEFGMCIRHPLVYSIMHPPQMNAYVNEQLRQKREMVRTASHEEQWDSYIWLHERPYRLQAFQEVMECMRDDEYWRILGRIWIDSENIRQAPEEWWELLESDRPLRAWIMDDEERADLDAMPAVIPVYQGHTAERDDGWSWTTDRDKAEWFARRFALLESDQPMLSIGTVAKSDVLAYLTSRSESEILVDRRKVTISEVVRL